MKALIGIISLMLTAFAMKWFFSAVKRSARNQSALEDGGTLAFPPCGLMKALIGIVSLMLTAFALLVGWTVESQSGPVLVVLIPLSILGAILVALPGAVVLDQEGIQQRFWWRTKKRILWRDVSQLVHDPQDGSTVVYGGHLPTISFSPYLVDQKRFEREVKNRSRVKAIPEEAI